MANESMRVAVANLAAFAKNPSEFAQPDDQMSRLGDLVLDFRNSISNTRYHNELLRRANLVRPTILTHEDLTTATAALSIRLDQAVQALDNPLWETRSALDRVEWFRKHHPDTLAWQVDLVKILRKVLTEIPRFHTIFPDVLATVRYVADGLLLGDDWLADKCAQRPAGPLFFYPHAWDAIWYWTEAFGDLFFTLLQNGSLGCDMILNWDRQADATWSTLELPRLRKRERAQEVHNGAILLDEAAQMVIEGVDTPGAAARVNPAYRSRLVYHDESEEPPDLYPHGPLIGNATELSDAVSPGSRGRPDSRPLQAKAASGAVWVRWMGGQTYHVFFRTQSAYEDAKRRLQDSRASAASNSAPPKVAEARIDQ